MTKSSGELVQYYAYDPYGNVINGDDESDFQYKDEQFDPNTSLTYMRARYYDPSLGKFISRVRI